MSGSRVAAALADSPWAARPGLRWRPGVAAVASPMWQGVEWEEWVVASDDGPDTLLLRLLHPDMAGFVDPAATEAGARAAMRAGVGPDVAFALPAHDAIAWQGGAPGRGARLDELGRRDVLGAVIAAKRALRRGPDFARAWDVFALIAAQAALARDLALPADVPDLLARVRAVGAALEAAGRDRAPCHNDGQASHVRLSPDGRVRLDGFDCAGQADPHYDLAVLLNEACGFEADWRAGIEMHDGACDERVLNRCRAYAVADDLLWGLRGLILSAVSPRRDLEFLKYGEWRLLRCRMALREPGFADRLHRL